MRYKRCDVGCDGTHPEGHEIDPLRAITRQRARTRGNHTTASKAPDNPGACRQSSSVVYHDVTIHDDNSHAGGHRFESVAPPILPAIHEGTRQPGISGRREQTAQWEGAPAARLFSPVRGSGWGACAAEKPAYTTARSEPTQVKTPDVGDSLSARGVSTNGFIPHHGQPVHCPRRSLTQFGQRPTHCCSLKAQS
jgi:hypothetical protein